MIFRTLDLSQYKNSLFLFGPRQVGKTFLIEHTTSPVFFINLLNHKEFLRYSKDVSLLSSEIAAVSKDKGLIVVDEIQRCPQLLNEIQSIMNEREGIQFILTGSSARKLKRASVNLLGGRAITVHLHPFTYEELETKFILEDAIRFGTLPPVVLQKEKKDKIRILKSYIEVYLKEEIQQEALTRNIPAFARFLELSAYENGKILNFQNIARETGIHSKTVKEYFYILEDTLIGFLLYPYGKSHRTKLVSHPKFYFFDCGVVAALKGELSQDLIPGSPPYGEAFEHWVILEIKRCIDYYERDVKLSFFRTTDGAEVDIIMELGKKVWAIEIKSSSAPRMSDVRGLRSFIKDHACDRILCLCQTPRPFIKDTIEFIPWKDFMEQLKNA
ncbi:MAG: AAA family ATPase [Candidatus Omnitrophota bacterium]|jgi:predicted AAA+ superfamily ATPase